MDKRQVIYEHQHIALDLLPEEHILNVQRQHPIALGTLFVTHFLLVVIVFSSVIPLILFKLLPVSSEILISLALFFISVLALIGTYTCMKWYFTFYIVTTKRIIICQFFKVIGTYYQELLLYRRAEQETKRVTANILYDLLDIEDIYITVHTEDIPEPFVFKTPQHPGQIEMALSQIEIQMSKL